MSLQCDVPQVREKVLLVANTAWYLYNFRLPLARFLRDSGYEVVLVSPRDGYVERLEAEKFRWVELPLNRKSVNPLKEALAVYQFCRIYLQERPSVCHHFTIKCVLYGTLAAKLTRVKAVVNAITGLGHAFIGNSILHKLVRPVLRFVYRRILTARRVQVVFQNGDDYAEFLDRNMVSAAKVTIIRGSGINLARFAPRPGPLEGVPAPTVLFASRLIKEKGILEYVEAARILRSKGVQATFAMAGDIDSGNPSSISEAELQAWCREGVIDYLGHVDQVEDVLALATVVVLPSYREGTPRILLEALAMGKPIVATDVPGCREVVREGYNGFLVQPRDAEALAAAIEKMIDDEDLRAAFGSNGRVLAHEFDEAKVIRDTVEVYRKAQGRASTPLTAPTR
jgi:glycosyltransferase involved in cell wall biosynthesis